MPDYQRTRDSTSWAVVGANIDRLFRKLIKHLPPLSLLPALVYLILLYALPLLRMLRLSLFDPNLTVENYSHIVKVAMYPHVILQTFEISFVVTLFCLLLGYPTAYLFAKIRSRVVNLLMIFILLPFLTSLLVRNYAWMVLLGRYGVINQLLISLGLIKAPLNLMFNRFGVYVAMTHILLPYMILSLFSVMRGIDQELMKAAENLGASPFRVFARIFLPLSTPGVIAGSILVFILAMGFFVTPAVIGGGTELMIANIIESNVSFLQWGFASALAVILLMVTVGLLFLSNKYIKLEDMLLGRQFLAGGGSQQITIGISGKAKRTRRLGILSVIRNWKDQYRFVRKFFTSLNCIATVLERASRPVIGFIVHNRQIFLRIVCGFVLFYLMLPVCIVLPMSFSSAEYLTFPPPSFSLKWYRSFFGDPMWLASAGRSMLIATLTMLLSITIAVPASFALVRHRFKWRSLAMVFILSPLVVPGIIVAIAIYFLHVRLHLIGTPIAVVLGHTIRGIAYAVVLISATLQGFDRTLERAAMSLGANQLKTFLRVVFPVIRAGVLSAGLFAFIYSFDELLIALFVSGVKGTTLPKKMWEGITEMINPTIAAASSLLIVFTVVFLVVLQLLQRGKRETDKT